MEEETQKNEKFDLLTGLLNRKNGEKEIIEALQESSGCLAFIDLDNLKKTNDIMGHLAGDYAIKGVGEVLLSFDENAIISRIGGDEFLYYIKDTSEEKAKDRIEDIMEAFQQKKTENTYLSFSSLSVGMCMTQRNDVYSEVLKKADRALYHMKQSGKAGYYMHTHTDGVNNRKASVDLNRIVKNLMDNRAPQGTRNLQYREFTKIYDFLHNLVTRFGYNIHFLMLTLEPEDYNQIDIEEQEYAMECMEKTIKEVLRSIDVSTRFSSEQILVILLNAQDKDVEVIAGRIFSGFHKIYHKNAVNLSYDIADLHDGKDI